MHTYTRVCARLHPLHTPPPPTHTLTHSLQQRKAQPKLANGGRKNQAKKVGGRRRAPKPAAEQRRSLTGGSVRASLRCLLLLTICVGLAPAVKTGHACFASLTLPRMRAASCGTFTSPTPRLEFGLETSCPYVVSSDVSHHPALEASFPTPVVSQMRKFLCFYLIFLLTLNPPTHNKLV